MRDETTDLNTMMRDLLADEPPASVDIARIKADGMRTRRTARARVALVGAVGAALLGGGALAAASALGGDGSAVRDASVAAPTTGASATSPAVGAPAPGPGATFEEGAQALAAVRAHLPPGIVAAEPEPGGPYAMTLTRADGGKTQLSFGTGNPVAPGSAPQDPCAADFLPPPTSGAATAPYTDCVRGVLPGGAKTVSASRVVDGLRMSDLYIVTPEGNLRAVTSTNEVRGPGGSRTLTDARLLTPAELTALASEPDVYAALVGVGDGAGTPVTGDQEGPSVTGTSPPPS